MLSNIQYWKQLSVLILYFLVFIKPTSSQGLACYKCMTTDRNNDGCRDPFSSLINPVQINCQVDWMIFFFRKKALSI
jgi:hypothetical protein